MYGSVADKVLRGAAGPDAAGRGAGVDAATEPDDEHQKQQRPPVVAQQFAPGNDDARRQRQILPGVLEQRLELGHDEGHQQDQPRGNERDLRDVPADARAGIRFHFVERMDEVIQLALYNGKSRRGAAVRPTRARDPRAARRRK